MRYQQFCASTLTNAGCSLIQRPTSRLRILEPKQAGFPNPASGTPRPPADPIEASSGSQLVCSHPSSGSSTIEPPKLQGPGGPASPIGAQSARQSGTADFARHSKAQKFSHDYSKPSCQGPEHDGPPHEALKLSHASPSLQGPGCLLDPHGAQCPFKDNFKKDLRPKVQAPICVRGSGLCPSVGWTISEYCPACHAKSLNACGPFECALSNSEVAGFFAATLGNLLAV